MVKQRLQVLDGGNAHLHHKRIGPGHTVAFEGFVKFFRDGNGLLQRLALHADPDERCNRHTGFSAIKFGVISEDDPFFLHSPHAFEHRGS